MRFPWLCLVSLAVACAPTTPPLASNQLVAVQVYSAIRTDGIFVYYIDDARIYDGVIHPGPYQLRLMRVSVSGGAPSVIAQLPPPGDDNYMAEFIIDATTAYCPIDAQIVAVPLAGGTPAVLVDEPMTVETLTVDDTSLYWVEGGAFSNATPYADDARVMRMAKSGGTPTVLVPPNQGLGSSATEIAVAGSALYWPGSSCAGTSTFHCFNDDIISSVPIAGGTTAVWTSSQASPGAVATDGLNLYWLNAGGDPLSGSLLTAPIASPSMVTSLAQGIPSPGVLASEAGTFLFDEVWNIQVAPDGTVFWLDAAGSGVHSAHAGTVTTYATGAGADRISHFTFDAVNVYWSTQYGGIFHAHR